MGSFHWVCCNLKLRGLSLSLSLSLPSCLLHAKRPLFLPNSRRHFNVFFGLSHNFVFSTHCFCFGGNNNKYHFDDNKKAPQVEVLHSCKVYFLPLFLWAKIK